MNSVPTFVAGNTRLRARMPRVWGPDPVQPPASGAAETNWLVEPDPQERAELRQLPIWYVGAARSVVQVLTGRYDLRDCLALLRGAITGREAEERLRATWTVGALTPARAAELAQAGDGTTAAQAMARLGLPTPRAAAALPDLWTRWELHGDIEELELGLTRAVMADWALRLKHRRSGAVAALLVRECDQRNLLAALARGAVDPARLLPPGRIGLRELEGAVAARWAPVLDHHPAWRAPLDHFATHQALAILDHELNDVGTSDAAVMLRRGEVESAEPLVGYVLLLEAQARQRRRTALLVRIGSGRSS